MSYGLDPTMSLPIILSPSPGDDKLKTSRIALPVREVK